MLRARRAACIRLLHNLRDPSILPHHVTNPVTTVDTLALTNPATGETITHVPRTLPSALPGLVPSPKLVSRWRETALKTRLSYLDNLKDLIRRHADDLAYLVHLEAGTPLPEALAEVDYAVDLLSWSSQPALHTARTTFTQFSPQHQSFSTLAPIGPVLAISPFNLPLALAIRKLAPALAAGCTVLAKPSEKATLPVLALETLLREAGVPDGVYTPIVGGGEVVGPLLTSDHVKMLSFTGSTRVGRLLQQKAGWKRCVLELGGNAPFIAFADCDIPTAAKDLARNGLRNAGQTCIAANRVFVHDDIYDAFVGELARRVRGAKVGPLIDPAAREVVLARIRHATDAGAGVAVGGARDGGVVMPTVLRDVADGMAVAREETFGPVFPVLRFADTKDVVRRANSGGGLAAYVYTRDVGVGMEVVNAVKAGMVGLNSVRLSGGETEFGGVAETGLGREGGLGAVEAYCERKFCVIES